MDRRRQTPHGRGGDAARAAGAAADAGYTARAEGMYGGGAEPGAKRTPDGEVAAAVRRVLATDGVPAHGAISVGVEQGWVTLEGDVTSLADRDRAGQEALTVDGALGIDDRLTIRQS